VPPLIFQPIIENAIWHGVANSIEQGRIIINIKLTGNFLKVTIENTGNSKSTADKNKDYAIKKKSYGLQIVKDRLAMLSKERKRKATLENKLQKSGMQVIVHLPLL
jgi:LytS/YehU family sensor histidine kinase